MRPDGGRRTPWTGGVLAALMGLAALTAFLWPLGFTLFVPLAGLLCAPLVWRGPAPAPMLALLALCGVAMVAVGWSPVFHGLGGIVAYEDLERQTWVLLPLQLALYASVVFAAVRLSPAAAARAVRVFVWAAAALALVVLMEGLSGASLYQGLRELSGDPARPDLARKHVAQATYALALMFWPAAIAMWRLGARIPLILLTLGTWLAPALLSAMAPLAALLASTAVFLVLRRASPRSLLAVGGALAATVLLTPWAVLALEPALEALRPSVGASWAARVDIWLFAAERVAERPLAGWGLEASRTFGEAIPLHPHNAPLQLWLELGVSGALAAAAFWLLLLRQAGRLRPGDATAARQAAAAATVYFVIGALSFGVWQEWWLALGALAAAWAVLAARVPGPPVETVIEA